MFVIEPLTPTTIHGLYLLRLLPIACSCSCCCSLPPARLTYVFAYMHEFFSCCVVLPASPDYQIFMDLFWSLGLMFSCVC